MLPSAAGVLGVVVGLLPGILVWILPVSAGVGLIYGLGRLRRQGWRAMQAAGVGGRQIALGLLPALAGLALVTAIVGTWLQPLGAELARASLLQAHPMAGRPVSVGDWTFAAREAQGVEVAGVMLAGTWGEEEVLGSALRGRLASEESLLRLEQGRLYQRASQTVIDFDTLELSLVPDLHAGPGRHPAYQRAIEWKRVAWPIGALALLLACIPLALAARGWACGLALLLYWVAVRTCDHVAPTTGAVLSAFLPPVLAWCFSASAWAAWRER
jgi:lipopolysaccharide export LptBFGC system permease protein LptF